MLKIVFFGNSYIVKSFVKNYKNNYEFIIIDRSLYDINFPNYEIINNLLSNIRPDIIIDSICPLLPINQLSEENINLLNNTIKHVHYINKLVYTYNIKKLIYLSSAGVIYSKNNSKEVTTYNNIQNLYALLKIQSECIYKYYSSINLNCQYQILRISNVYGNPENHKTMDNGIINIILKNYKNNIETHITSSNISKNYIYINDLINIINYLISYSFVNNYEIINIGSPYSYTINDIISIISNKLPIKIKIDNNKHYNNNYFTINIDKLLNIIDNYNFTKLETYINSIVKT